MSTAFRNFFIAFIITLLGAGTFGHFFVNDTLPEMLNKDPQAQNEEYYSYDDFSQADTDIDPVVADTTFTGVIYCCDVEGELSCAIFFRTNETKKTYTFCNLPINSSIDVNNKSKTLKDIFSTQGHQYLSSRLVYLTGYKVDKYAIIRPSGFAKISEYMHEARFTPLEYNLSFEFKYEDPEYAEINAVLPADQRYYKSLSGRTILDEETVLALTTRNEVFDKTLQDNTVSDMYFQTFRQIFSQSNIAKSEMSIKRMLEYVAETDFQQKDIAACAPYLFALCDSSYTAHGITYPLLGVTGREPNWESAIQLFRDIEQ